MLWFISLMIIVILGVGFYYHANLWPDHVEFWKGNWTQWRIWKIFYYPYWQLYGETFNDFFTGKQQIKLQLENHRMILFFAYFLAQINIKEEALHIISVTLVSNIIH